MTDVEVALVANQKETRGAITWRSVTLGLLGVVLIAALTPYNDYALNNTNLVGNNLPLGLVMLTFLFAILVNGPLSRYAPRWALSSGEMGVAFSMILVGCAMPTGLMRWFPGSLVGPMWLGRENGEYLSLLESLGLPAWIYPSFEGSGPRHWVVDPIVGGYLGRWTEEGMAPYLAWVRPALVWGVFLFALFGSLFCMVTIVRRQWFDNERLAFPLAQIQLALIEAPEKGRWLNRLLQQPAFWIAFGAVFFVRMWNGGAEYYPKYFAEIPTGYNFTAIITDPPFVYAAMKQSKIYFIVVGVTYFLSTPVAFSLWAFYVLEQIYRMILGTTTGDATHYGLWDEHTGGVLAFGLTVLWIGRHHWKLVLAQAFRGARKGEPQERYLPYAVAFWGLLGCAVIMGGWLWLAGCSAVGAGVLVVLLLFLNLMITRVVGETGLVYSQLLVPMYRPWQMLGTYGWPGVVSNKTFFFSSMLQVNFFDFRETVPVYTSHALKLGDQTMVKVGEEERTERRTGRRFLGLLFGALVLSYLVSFGSMLWTEYNYAVTRDITATTPINQFGASGAQKEYVLEPTLKYAKGNYNEPFSPLGHLGAGFVITSLLGWLRLRYTWWPLHPIGYIMIPTTPIGRLWFSILLGWLCKVLIVKFGGSSLFTKAKGFFMGMIVGESIAAGVWLVMCLILNWMNVPFHVIRIMPN